jgi:hypothetical protein
MHQLAQVLRIALPVLNKLHSCVLPANYNPLHRHIGLQPFHTTAKISRWRKGPSLTNRMHGRRRGTDSTLCQGD